MSDKIQHINPDGLSKNPAFSQVVTTQGNGKTVYIGGQDAVKAEETLLKNIDKLITQLKNKEKNIRIP